MGLRIFRRENLFSYPHNTAVTLTLYPPRVTVGHESPNGLLHLAGLRAGEPSRHFGGIVKKTGLLLLLGLAMAANAQQSGSTAAEGDASQQMIPTRLSVPTERVQTPTMLP